MKSKIRVVWHLLLVAYLSGFASTGIGWAETIAIVEKMDSITVQQDAQGHTLTMDGYQNTASAGDPMLPQKEIRILVPPDAVWESLQLSAVEGDIETLTGPFSIKPAFPDAASVGGKTIYDWSGKNNIVDGKNMDIYGVSSFHPVKTTALLPYSQMRKWKFARIQISPIQYNPVTGSIRLVRRIEMKLSFLRSTERPSGMLMRDRVMDDLAPQLFRNYAEGKSWYLSPDEESGGPTTRGFAIITTSDIVNGSARLSSFIAHKQRRGYSVRVVTENDFSTLVGQAPNHRAEKIRKWLMNNYLSQSIETVLLIGDPTPYETAGANERIPMKMCWPRLADASDKESPTDAFYADLTGNWDLDGDQYFGELTDYTGSGGVDFSMEVRVGRIPVYGASYAALDDILQKIMDYENATSISWRKRVLLPMSFSAADYDGAPLAEQMIDDFLGGLGYGSGTQYQQGSGACGADSAYSSDQELRGGNVVGDRWAANDYGVVCWWGHGSPTSASVGYDGCWDGILFDAAKAPSLDDGHPSFAYMCSCNNAYPENQGNLAYAILKHGGIGTVSATRISWFNTSVGYGWFDGSSTNSGIGYEFVRKLTKPMEAGRALSEAKMAVVPDIASRNTRLMNLYDFNLYGDPSLRLDAKGNVGDFYVVPKKEGSGAVIYLGE